jgi:hypothetical protein
MVDFTAYETVSSSRVEAIGWAGCAAMGGSSGMNRLSSPSSTAGSAGGVLGADMRRERSFKAPISSGELVGGAWSRTESGQFCISDRRLLP